MESPQGSVSSVYNDYEKVEGIPFPMSMTQTMGPQTFDIKVKSVKINKGIDDSQFAL